MQGRKYKDEWQSLRRSVAATTTTVKEWLAKHRGLFELIDSSFNHLAESLYSKMNNLIALEAEIQTFYS